MTATNDVSETRSNGGSGGGDDGLSVSDPEEYNSQRRLRQIHNARERFGEIRREARERYNPANERASEITKERYQEIVANALIDYLVEVEPVMMTAAAKSKSGSDKDADGPTHPAWSQEVVAEAPDGSDITLETIVEKGGEVPREDGEGTEPITELQARKAYRRANKFLASVGLGLRLDQSGLPMIRGFDPSTGSKPGIDNATMKGDPEL